MGKEGREFLAPYDSFTLRQGDMVYIPRGYVHAGECSSEPSLHITLGMISYSWEELLRAGLKAAVRSDSRLLEALPLGFMAGDGEPLVKRAAAAFRKLADESFLRAAIDQYRDELVTKFPIDVSGQVQTVCQPVELTRDDIVGPRPGIVYRMSANEDSVRVVLGAHTLTFPGFLHEPLQFALKTPVYAVRDIVGGELEDEEKVVFTARLLEEGLIVRK